MNAEPAGTIPAMEAWRRRDPHPLVVARCNAKRGRCREELGDVWSTPEGYVLRFYRHVPRYARTVVGAALLRPAVLRAKAKPDERGLVMFLNGEAAQLAVLTCTVHGWARVDEAALIAAARQAKPGGPLEVRVTVNRSNVVL